jgi:hypothetical protein
MIERYPWLAAWRSSATTTAWHRRAPRNRERNEFAIAYCQTASELLHERRRN